MTEPSYPPPPRKRPTAWLYLLACLLPIGGCFASAATASSGLGNMGESFAKLPRASVPGDADVTLERGATIVLYETPLAAAGAAGAKIDLRCTLRGPDESEVPLTKPSGQSSYTVNRRSARAVFVAEIKQAGVHKLSCLLPQEASADAAPDAQLVFVSTKIFIGMAKYFVPALLGTLGGITLAIVVFFMRRRSVA